LNDLNKTQGPTGKAFRVLMTVDTIGGVWSYALELARAFENHRSEITLASMGRALTTDQRRELRELSNVAIFESDYKLEWMEDPWDDVDAAGVWLLELEARTQPDIIHLNGFAHGSLPWSAPCLVVGHSCVGSWFRAVKGTATPPLWQEYRNRVTAGLRSARSVTAPTQTMLDTLSTEYGGFTAADVVYNGRRAADYPTTVKEPFIFTAGRLWDEAKNVAVLQRVAPSVPWPIYAAGDRRGCVQFRRELDGLVLLGQLDSQSMAHWLGRAAIFVLPARYEPFGLSALEAALAGCALVLGDIPSLREVWGDAALFVTPDNPEEISTTIYKLIREPSLRRALASKARRRALFFTPERMAQGYMNLYREMLSSHRQDSVVFSFEF
jgi:glycogen(starch) synthase